MYLSLYCKGLKKVIQGLRVRGSWRPNINCNILTPKVMAVNVCVFLVLQGCSTGGPRAHSAGCWLSLLHLISIFSGPQFIRAPSPFGLVWLSLPQLISTGTRTQLSYLIIRRPLDLWNRMFNRHRAEITVIQFRGHSLPVHHSVVAQWDLHLVPYYQP